jgi:hypothetical protein
MNADSGRPPFESAPVTVRIPGKSCPARDLLEWWIDHEAKAIEELNLDALCVYPRLMYQMLEKENKLGEEAPDFYEKALQEAEAERTLSGELRTWSESQGQLVPAELQTRSLCLVAPEEEAVTHPTALASSRSTKSC